MKKQIALFVWLVLCLGACKKEDPEKEGPCGVKNPIEDLEWLKKEIELFSSPPGNLLSHAYFTAIYRGKRVFWLYYPHSSSFSQYRTCDGERHFIPSTDEDEETARFRLMLRNSNKYCQYLLWGNQAYKQTPGGCH